MKAKRYTSWRQVAEAVGAARTALVEQRKREDWPAPRTMPRDGLTQKQVDAIRRWRADLPRAGQTATATDPVTRDVHLAHRKEQTALMRVRRELLEGRYIEQALHEAAMLAVTDCFVRLVEALPTTIATTVPNLEPEQRGAIERVIASQVNRQRTRLAALATLTLDLSSCTGLHGFSAPATP